MTEVSGVVRLGGSGWDAALSHRQAAPRTRLIFDVNATVSMDQFARAPSSRRRAISVCTAVKVSRSMMAWMAFSTRYCGNWPVLRTARPGLPSGVDHRPNKSSKPADYCQVHHLVPWKAGGAADPPNLTMLCAYHNGVNDDDPDKPTGAGYVFRLRGTVGWVPPAGRSRLPPSRPIRQRKRR